MPRLGGVQDQAKQRAGPGAPRSGAGGWDTAMPGTLHSPSSRAILSKLCAQMLLCGAGGSLPLRRPASAVRMAGKRGSSFNLARLVDDGPYPAEGSEHNADLVRTLPRDLFRVAGSHHVGTITPCRQTTCMTC